MTTMMDTPHCRRSIHTFHSDATIDGHLAETEGLKKYRSESIRGLRNGFRSRLLIWTPGTSSLRPN